MHCKTATSQSQDGPEVMEQTYEQQLGGSNPAMVVAKFFMKAIDTIYNTYDYTISPRLHQISHAHPSSASVDDKVSDKLEQEKFERPGQKWKEVISTTC